MQLNYDLEIKESNGVNYICRPLISQIQTDANKINIYYLDLRNSSHSFTIIFDSTNLVKQVELLRLFFIDEMDGILTLGASTLIKKRSAKVYGFKESI